ncbi:MAG: hypothetical protein LBL58_17420 [Tannerellaceae bacterium]|jgi:hypothetical protein|nr:hypothetical protein [Tannerellaceae bacterium]
MKKARIKDLLPGKTVTIVQLSKLVDISEYKKLLEGETIHKWEHTKSGMKEIKLLAV